MPKAVDIMLSEEKIKEMLKLNEKRGIYKMLAPIGAMFLAGILGVFSVIHAIEIPTSNQIATGIIRTISEFMGAILGLLAVPLITRHLLENPLFGKIRKTKSIKELDQTRAKVKEVIKAEDKESEDYSKMRENAVAMLSEINKRKNELLARQLDIELDKKIKPPQRQPTVFRNPQRRLLAV